MKRIYLCLFCILFNNFIGADTWQEYWMKAIENCDQKNFAVASEMFDQAIINMENDGDIEHPHVYVDRARLSLLLERNELALADLDKALINKKITKKEKSRAALSRMIAKSRLGIEIGVLDDLQLFIDNCEDKPIVENSNSHVIIRNVPDCSCYHNIMTCYYIHSGICNSKNDIQKLNSGIWLIKKTNSCGCDSEKIHEDRFCDACGMAINENAQEQIDTCNQWCDRIAIASVAWCSSHFKSGKCQAACAVAVYEIQQGCYWCCKGKGFYERCVKPFEDIAKHIKAPCDPMWD